jgi:hypothetical protein
MKTIFPLMESIAPEIFSFSPHFKPLNQLTKQTNTQIITKNHKERQKDAGMISAIGHLTKKM